MPLPNQPWPLRENIDRSPDGRVVFSAQEYGLSERLTREIHDWTAWWEEHGERSDRHHVEWAKRIVRDLERELGQSFRVTYYPS